MIARLNHLVTRKTDTNILGIFKPHSFNYGTSAMHSSFIVLLKMGIPAQSGTQADSRSSTKEKKQRTLKQSSNQATNQTHDPSPNPEMPHISSMGKTGNRTHTGSQPTIPLRIPVRYTSWCFKLIDANLTRLTTRTLLG
jgi:hypothetical protein